MDNAVYLTKRIEWSIIFTSSITSDYFDSLFQLIFNFEFILFEFIQDFVFTT